MFTALLLPFVVVALVATLRFFLKARPTRPHPASVDAAIQRRLRWLGAGILAAGLTGAGAIYLRTGGPDTSHTLGYDLEGGKSFAITTDQSRPYAAQMQMIGGKANLFATEIVDWFHGRKLAYTLGAFSIGSALVCFYLAKLSPPPESGS